MDTAVGLVQAYLRVNGYFTVAEYPVLDATGPGGPRTITDLDILAVRLHRAPGASGTVDAPLDPALGAGGGADMIVGEVKRYLRDNNAVRVSRSIRDLAYHSMQAREELQKQNGREPKLSEIAARVGQSPENVAMALESAVTPTSLYEPVYSDGEDSFALLDQLRDATGEESWISDMMFRDTVRALTPRERRIIALRYLNGKTQTQVAKEIGISQAQVSRLEKAALNHIKEQICAN